VGLDDAYLALYSPKQRIEERADNYAILNGLNHVGVVVDNIDEIESRVVKAGLKPHNFSEFEPVKRRFYFNDHDGVEYEVLSY
jgi:hypothetical protein